MAIPSKFKVGDKVRWLKNPTRETTMNMDWFPYRHTGIIKEVYLNDMVYIVMNKFAPHSPHTEDLHNPDYPFSSVVDISDIELVEEETLEINPNHFYTFGMDMCLGELGGYPIYQTKEKQQSIMSKITTFAKNLVLSADEKLLRKYGLHDECGNHTDEAEELVIAKLVKENEAYLVELATTMQAEEAKK